MENKKVPVVDFAKCTHCDKCIIACKDKVITKANNDSCAKCVKYCISLTIPCKPDILHFDYKRCTACGDCIIVCPEHAIHWYYIESKVQL